MPKFTAAQIKAQAENKINLDAENQKRFIDLETQASYDILFGNTEEENYDLLYRAEKAASDSKPGLLQEGLANQGARRAEDREAHETLDDYLTRRQFVPEEVRDIYDRVYNEYSKLTQQMKEKHNNITAYQKVIESTDSLDMAALAFQHQQEQRKQRDQLDTERAKIEYLIGKLKVAALEINKENNFVDKDPEAGPLCKQLGITPSQLGALMMTPRMIPQTIRYNLGDWMNIETPRELEQQMGNPAAVEDDENKIEVNKKCNQLLEASLFQSTRDVLKSENRSEFSMVRLGGKCLWSEQRMPNWEQAYQLKLQLIHAAITGQPEVQLCNIVKLPDDTYGEQWTPVQFEQAPKIIQDRSWYNDIEVKEPVFGSYEEEELWKNANRFAREQAASDFSAYDMGLVDDLSVLRNIAVDYPGVDLSRCITETDAKVQQARENAEGLTPEHPKYELLRKDLQTLEKYEKDRAAFHKATLGWRTASHQFEHIIKSNPEENTEMYKRALEICDGKLNTAIKQFNLLQREEKANQAIQNINDAFKGPERTLDSSLPVRLHAPNHPAQTPNERSDYNTKVFDETFQNLFPAHPTMDKPLPVYDAIFIDGRSLRDRCPPHATKREMKDYFMSCVMNGRHNLEVVGYDKNGELTAPTRISCQVDVPNPPLTRWQKIKQKFDSTLKQRETREYRQQSLVAEDQKNPEKAQERQAQIAMLAQRQHFKEMEVLFNQAKVQAYTHKLDQRVQEEDARITRFAEQSEQLRKTRTTLTNQLGKACYGERYLTDSVGGLNLPNTQLADLRINGLTLAAAVLYSEGMSIQDIFDPEKELDKKQEAGMKVIEMVAADDAAALKELTEKFRDAAMKEPIPPINLASIEDINRHAGLTYMMGDVMQNLYNGTQRLEKALPKEELDKLRKSLEGPSTVFPNVVSAALDFTGKAKTAREITAMPKLQLLQARYAKLLREETTMEELSNPQRAAVVSSLLEQLVTPERVEEIQKDADLSRRLLSGSQYYGSGSLKPQDDAKFQLTSTAMGFEITIPNQSKDVAEELIPIRSEQELKLLSKATEQAVKFRKELQAHKKDIDIVCKQCFGKYAKGDACDLNNHMPIRLGRQSVTLPIAYLYGLGHSAKDIFDPSALIQEKQAAGKYILDLYERAKDSKQNEQVGREYIDMIEKFSERVKSTPLPAVKLNDPESILANYHELYILSECGFNLHQEVEQVTNPDEEQRIKRVSADLVEFSVAPIVVMREIPHRQSVLAGKEPGGDCNVSGLMWGDVAQQLVGDLFDGKTSGRELVAANKAALIKNIRYAFIKDTEIYFKKYPELTVDLLSQPVTCKITHDPKRNICAVSTAVDERLGKEPTYFILTKGEPIRVKNFDKEFAKKVSFSKLMKEEAKSPGPKKTTAQPGKEKETETKAEKKTEGKAPAR